MPIDAVIPDTPIEADWGNDVATAINALLPAPTNIIPAVFVKETTGQTVVSGGNNAVQWSGTEDIDTHGFHSTVTNNHRLTVPTGLGGLYYVTYAVYCAPGAEIIAAWVIKNGLVGGTRYALSQGKNDTVNGVTVHGSLPMVLLEGDYVEVNAFQNSGSNKVLNAGDALGYFGMFRIGPA